MIVDLYLFRILDDFGHELEMTDSKLQQTVLKVEKVLRLSDGRRLVFCFNSLKPLLLMTTLVQPRFFGNQFLLCYCYLVDSTIHLLTNLGQMRKHVKQFIDSMR